MGERGDIIKTMHREMTAKGVMRAATDYVLHDPAEESSRSIVGRLVSRGLSDEINDRHYLIVDGVDGRTHYIDIGKGEATEPTPEGTILRIDPKRPEPRPVDRTRRPKSPPSMTGVTTSISIYGMIHPPAPLSPRHMSAGWKRCDA